MYFYNTGKLFHLKLGINIPFKLKLCMFRLRYWINNVPIPQEIFVVRPVSKIIPVIKYFPEESAHY